MTRALRNLLEKDVHVLIDGELVLLPPEPKPTIVNATASGPSTSLTLDGPGGAGSFTLSVTEAAPSFTIGLPEPEEGVYLLVSMETLMRLPHRTDLLSPAYYTMMPDRVPGSRLESYLSAVYSSVHVNNDEVPPLIFDEDVV